MRVELGYGSISQQIDVPDSNVVDILRPNHISVLAQGANAVKQALNHPIGTRLLREIVAPGEKIIIVTSDITRPLPSYLIIPCLLEELNNAGVSREDITVVFARGSHRPHTPYEMEKILGEEIYSTIKCIDSDPDEFVHLGQTSMGTPVDITKEVALADRRICIANIEYHYFAGYSGGAKSIMPGVSTRAAIQANHRRMVIPEATAGRMEDNPVRKDLEEAVNFCPIDFIVNVVLDEQKNIIHAVAGHYIKAHREGCRFLDSIYLKKIDSKVDIVIVSQGGAPKDLNLYQTQKALDNAKHAVKRGGVIILVGSCRDGLGDDVFGEWMMNADSPRSIIKRIQKDFQLGGHKAAAIALVLEDADVFLVSELNAKLVRSLFLQPYATVQEALDVAFKKMGRNAKVMIMPYGGSTLPLMSS
jgi:nickel-dependent lactate racemase